MPSILLPRAHGVRRCHPTHQRPLGAAGRRSLQALQALVIQTTTHGVGEELVGLLEPLEVPGRLSCWERGGVWMQCLAATTEGLTKAGLRRLGGHSQALVVTEVALGHKGQPVIHPRESCRSTPCPTPGREPRSGRRSAGDPTQLQLQQLKALQDQLRSWNESGQPHATGGG